MEREVKCFSIKKIVNRATIALYVWRVTVALQKEKKIRLNSETVGARFCGFTIQIGEKNRFRKAVGNTKHAFG